MFSPRASNSTNCSTRPARVPTFFALPIPIDDGVPVRTRERLKHRPGTGVGRQCPRQVLWNRYATLTGIGGLPSTIRLCPPTSSSPDGCIRPEALNRSAMGNVALTRGSGRFGGVNRRGNVVLSRRPSCPSIYPKQIASSSASSYEGVVGCVVPFLARTSRTPCDLALFL
jgi:hypothetical protein